MMLQVICKHFPSDSELIISLLSCSIRLSFWPPKNTQVYNSFTYTHNFNVMIISIEIKYFLNTHD
jgi:hypothetical protein